MSSKYSEGMIVTTTVGKHAKFTGLKRDIRQRRATGGKVRKEK